MRPSGDFDCGKGRAEEVKVRGMDFFAFAKETGISVRTMASRKQREGNKAEGHIQAVIWFCHCVSRAVFGKQKREVSKRAHISQIGLFTVSSEANWCYSVQKNIRQKKT